MKKLLILLFFATAFTKVHSQNAPLFPSAYYSIKNDGDKMQYIIRLINDSLRGDNYVHIFAWARAGFELAEKNAVDSLKGSFLMYMGKAYYYYYEKIDSAIYFFKKSTSFFHNKLNDDNAVAVRSIMDGYADLGQKDSCFKYVDEALRIMNALPDTSYSRLRLAEIIGTDYSWFGMYKSAMRLFDIARKGYTDKKINQSVGMVLSHIAFIYDELDDDVNAISYWKQSLPYLEGLKRPYATNCSNIASGYYDLKQPDSAKVYLAKSVTLANEIGALNQVWSNEKVRGQILILEGNYGEARQVLNKCLSYFEGNNDPRRTALTLIAMSNLDSATGSPGNAEKNLRRALEISRRAGLQATELRALQGLAGFAAVTGNYRKAWNYRLAYDVINDSISRDKAATDLADFEVLYKTQQKEQEILLLKKDNDIKTLQLRNSRQSLYLYIGGFALLFLLTGVFFYQRNRRHKAEAEKLNAELKTQVLRSQMNPHFIFNCLNSIESFIMQNNKRQASDYLNKFSRLIRSILDSSRNEVVPLAKDMEALSLYVELEQLRFDYKFNFSTFIDPALSGGDYRVPALLIQPYVENAIVHGLANSDEDGLSLTVTASLQDDKIKYMIQDNGIGRNKAFEYTSRNKPNHKSVGLKITEQRINIFNGDYNHEAVMITDLYDEHRNPGGTKVEVTIKAT